MKKTIVLLSGGLDSATVLYYAKRKGYRSYGLIFDYGQRHRREIKSAQDIACSAGVSYLVLKISLPWKGSSLLDKNVAIRTTEKINPRRIPTTYVPARNIIFLSFAASYAEAVGAEAIFIGANAVDFSGYPDCRPRFFKAYQKTISLGLKSAQEGIPIKIFTPLVHKTKAQIIRLGMTLGVPYHLTWSCYRGGRRPCGRCDSCRLREKGFSALKIKDPLLES